MAGSASEAVPTSAQTSSHFGMPLAVMLAPWVLASIACVYVVPRVLCWFRTWRTLRSMPGPWDLLPFWYLLLCFRNAVKVKKRMGASERLFNQMRELCQDYPDKTFKVYAGVTPLVFINTPDAAQTLLTSARNHKKPFAYHFTDSWLGPSNLLVSTGDAWRYKKKVLTPAFHFGALDDYIPIFNENGDSLVKHICDAIDAAPSDPVPLFNIAQKCTMDIIAEVTMGKKLGLQENKNPSLVASFNRAMMLVPVRCLSPWFWVQAIYDITSQGKGYKGAVEEMVNLTHSVMRQHLETSNGTKMTSQFSQHDTEADSSKKASLIDRLMKTQKEDEKYTLDDVVGDINTILGGGNDTAALAVCWALNLLGHNADAQRKAHEELDEIFGSSRDGEITADDLKKMKYLECCLKEALRLYPSFPVIGRTLEEDLVIDGQTVPKGVTCVIAIFSIHRNPNHFKDPDSFVPERFMTEEIKQRHPFSYIPFSKGLRVCIGDKFAMVEMKLLLAKVLRKFEVESRIPLDQLRLTYEIVLKDKGGNKVWLRRRPEFCSALETAES
ncbi:cytochrome P450 4V2 [Ixodes scapularis]|uniref:cytochrome P450 4V2 n=1 Tax=Ixodes scapularis TaxID=6945 RepID=UPI001C3894CE|nr:cytochrome P450 4V2 [Ixodes scapularis]